LSHLVQGDLVVTLTVQGTCVRIDRFHRSNSISLDTGNLDHPADWVASHAQIVLHSNLSCMFDFLVASTESQRP
jgi:hypothetical protein